MKWKPRACQTLGTYTRIVSWNSTPNVYDCSEITNKRKKERQRTRNALKKATNTTKRRRTSVGSLNNIFVLDIEISNSIMKIVSLWKKVMSSMDFNESSNNWERIVFTLRPWPNHSFLTLLWCWHRDWCSDLYPVSKMNLRHEVSVTHSRLHHLISMQYWNGFYFECKTIKRIAECVN